MQNKGNFRNLRRWSARVKLKPTRTDDWYLIRLGLLGNSTSKKGPVVGHHRFETVDMLVLSREILVKYAVIAEN